MVYHLREFERILMLNAVHIFLTYLYVDDYPYFGDSVIMGAIYNSEIRTIEFSERQRLKNIESCQTPESKTAEVFKTVMKSITTCVEMTTETVRDFEDKKLPTLDCSLWVEVRRVCKSPV